MRTAGHNQYSSEGCVSHYTTAKDAYQEGWSPISLMTAKEPEPEMLEDCGGAETESGAEWRGGVTLDIRTDEPVQMHGLYILMRK